MQDIGTPLLHGLIPILTMAGLELIFTFGIMKNLKFRILICGKPSLVIQQGKVIQKELVKSRISVDELLEKLRLKDVTDISQVKYGILETSGDLSTILYSKYSPVAVSDMNLSRQDNGLPIAVVNDGKLLEHNMRIRNVDESWVRDYLQKKNAPGHKDIFLMTIDDLGNVYISEKESNS
jgi:uncharacterized membrane protein YcaP (DUF421 family)